MSKRTIATYIGALILFLIGLAPIFRGLPVAFLKLAPFSLITALPTLFFMMKIHALANTPIVGAIVGAIIVPIIFFIAANIMIKYNLKYYIIFILILLVFLTSLAFMIVSWGLTIKIYPGPRAYALAFQAMVPPVILMATLLAGRNRLSMNQKILIQWLACAWLTWSAFPWWGEML